MSRVTRGLSLRTLAISLAVAALGYLAFVLWGGWRDVLAASASIGFAGLAAVFGLSLINYALRFIRWQIYLTALGRSVPLAQSALIYASGFALTTTPGKAGELVRGIFLHRHGVSFTASTAAFVSERLSDLVGVAALAMFGLAAYPTGRPLAFFAGGLIVLGLVMVSRPRMLASLRARIPEGRGTMTEAARHLLSLLVEASRCHRPGVLIIATLLSLVAWSAEAYGAWLVLCWLGFDAGLAFAAGTYALGMLAGALSFLPGGLGGTEAVMVAILLGGGMPGAAAVAATVIIRVATLWFAVAIGVAALLAAGGLPAATSGAHARG